MKQRAHSLAALLLLAAAFLASPVLLAQAPDDRVVVRTVVENYLRGLRFNDVESLKKAFWPEAKLYFVKSDGTLGQLTQEAWYAGFANAAGKESKADFRIAALEVTNDVASVKVVETYPSARYTDYLSLVRFDGKWMIVNKIYTEQKAAR